MLSFVVSVKGEFPHPNFIPKYTEPEARTNKTMKAMILLKVNPDVAEYKRVKKMLIKSPMIMLNNNLLCTKSVDIKVAFSSGRSCRAMRKPLKNMAMGVIMRKMKNNLSI